jgi:serine/threonine-protein kinase PRP4
MNLREALTKFGKGLGINIGAVRLYGLQLMRALALLAQLKVVHADIKLDNILCSADLKTVQLCDFGSAFYESSMDARPTPYLVSRFYRAPEIVLGLPYGRALDMWAVGTCLYELFTGSVLFPGQTNNDMLRLYQDAAGRFSNKAVRAHLRAYHALELEPHFAEDARFKHATVDPVSGAPIVRLVEVPAVPVRDLSAELRRSKACSDDARLVLSLASLLQGVLQLDPSRRTAVDAATAHPFFSVER